jgi:hypothetical protein
VLTHGEIAPIINKLTKLESRQLMPNPSTTNSEKMAKSARLLLTRLKRTRDSLRFLIEFSRKQRKQNDSNWNRLIAGAQSLVVKCSNEIDSSEAQTLGAALLDLNLFIVSLKTIAYEENSIGKLRSEVIVSVVRDRSFSLKSTISRMTPCENYLKVQLECRILENVTTL